MSKNCEKCKYSNYDYIWDDEIGDEYPLYSCEKGHSDYFDDDNVECPHFKRFKVKPYAEEDTKCDKCEYLEECKSKHEVLDCATLQDTRNHYIVGCGADCKKMG